MRRPKNTTGIQATFGIDFAPEAMIDHGLVEAHSFPLVSYGKLRSEYVSWRMPASEAWRFPEVEQRTPNSWPVLVLDVDGADASARIHEAIFGGRISVPNWVVQRRASGGCHAFWTLKRPPLYGVDAAPGPVSLYTRIAEWYTAALDADPDFIAALSHNAVYQGGEFATDWLATEAYSLAALARPIPKGWKRPPRVKLQSAAGRNSSLFNAGMKWAGSIHRAGMAVLPVLAALNGEFEHPLPGTEVEGIARSVERYRDQWTREGSFWGPGNHTYGDSEAQAERGRKSGRRRREGTAERDRAWLAAYNAGQTLRDIAALAGVAPSTVKRALDHLLREPTQLMPAGESPHTMRDSGGDVVGAGSDSGKIAHQLEPIVDNQPSTVDNLWTSRGLFDAPAEAFSAAEADRLAALAAAGAWDDPAMVELHQRARTLAAQGDAAASVAVEAVRRQHRAGRARTEREHD